MEKTRMQVAHKVKIKDILDSQYVKEEGEWTPNYIIINNKQVSRVNVMAIVISIPESDYKSIVINDGSESIAVRSFEEKEFKVSVSDMVQVIGRPREFNNEKYIVPEIIKKIDDKRWVDIRKLELQLKGLKQKPVKKEEVKTNLESVEEDLSNSTNPPDKIFNMIKETDSGEGADMQEIISKSSIPEAEDIIKNLLKEGEVFEIKPGKLKVLE